jgi:anti-sigma B factor antagonist
MSISIDTRKMNDVSVLDVTGKITLGDGAGAMRDTLRTMAKDGQKKILLNLGEVSMIDSSGLGVLVAGFASISNQGGQLKLLNLTTRTRDLLLITKLFTVFEVFEDEAVAVRSFAPAPAQMPNASA